MAAEKCSQVTPLKTNLLTQIYLVKKSPTKFWKLKKDTLLNIYKTLIGSVIDYSFFIPTLTSNSNLSKIQTIQNISIKSIYHFPFNTPSDLLVKFLEEIKFDKTEVRLFEQTFQLIKDYVSAFINSSRICSNKTPLCDIWN
ncbi:hypothetical protein BpHYR1_023600 [Brachionus plicatilis]|uniref:RNA-directed DNA polymerase from mobile element jockey-like n=1 Tax=Brachionus plicatilis TaxID=10195 RepID=A0A3M7QYP8_BRAPC|nr:hypothetical protein BpHYR1_023600 [Brachionus plicatilis]